MTASGALMLAHGVDSTKGPWVHVYPVNLTSSGGGSQTLFDVPTPSNSTGKVMFEIDAIRTDGARHWSIIGGIAFTNAAGTAAVGTQFAINNDDFGEGHGYAVTATASSGNVRISVNDQTDTIRIGAIITRTHRNSTA